MTTHDQTQRATGERAEVFRAGNGWTWRSFAANGEEVSRCSESYTHRYHAINEAHERNPGLRVFVPGFNTDGTAEAKDWVEIDFSEGGEEGR